MPVVGVFGYIVDVIFRVGCDNENWPCLLAKYGRPIARLKQNANIHQLAGLNVREETSKTGIRRIVDMEPLLLRWLDYYVRSGGSIDGAVVPAQNLRKRLRTIRVAAGFEYWPQDAPWRTYASN